MTPRQLELAELLADGHTNEELARPLNLGLDTVKKYVSRILLIAGVRNRAEFVKLVYAGSLSATANLRGVEPAAPHQ